MAHDEAVATQKTGKAASPPKDQPAPYPYPDWATMQAYYGPGVLPPTYFAPALAPGHAAPYMWGPQPIMPHPFGTPYAAMYPHNGAYPHPLVPMMSNQLNVEPAKSANSKDKSFSKKLKQIDGTAASAGSGNSKRTMSSSEDYSAEGSSDVNDQKVSKTARKRTSDDGPGAETAAKMEGAAISPPGAIVPAHNGVPTDLSVKDERELKREKRKQSNRESARRSRMRKQAETEELATQVESLAHENASLKSEISRLTNSSEKLRLENSSLMVKLKDPAGPKPAEPSMDKASTSSSPQGAENFLSMIDSTNTAGAGHQHTEHGEPKLRQLFDSQPATDVAAVS
ncbi:hypothetical protein QOZ80_5BG0410770 [Eleusine coracana subsp. coracana]|nr:hypothetical protein QOZ80_5BG0410770 [Eleusine coracana subsp. coracana]